MTGPAAYTAQADEALARLAQHGDAAAFSTLVYRFERPLYGYLHRMLGNSADAADAFQETFLRVHKNLHRYRPDQPFKAWLYAIATNLSIDLLRRRKRWRFLRLGPATEDGPVVDPADTAPGPAQRAEAAETHARIEAALAKLSPEHRAVFVMARYEGLSYEAISDALDIPVGTVKSRMNTATSRLVRLLRGDAP